MDLTDHNTLKTLQFMKYGLMIAIYSANFIDIIYTALFLFISIIYVYINKLLILNRRPFI